MSWHVLYWIPEYTGTGPAGRAGLKFKSSQDRQVAHKRDSLLWYSLAVGNGASERCKWSARVAGMQRSGGQCGLQCNSQVNSSGSQARFSDVFEIWLLRAVATWFWPPDNLPG